jgi:isoleucyl-tRNA synthetase
VHVHTDEVVNGEPEKFKEWKWFTKEELVSIYDDIFEVDRYAIDVYLGRADTQKYTSPVYVLAWTTTPWTIPANMALAVRSDIVYVLVANGAEQYIVAKNRVDTVFK